LRVLMKVGVPGSGEREAQAMGDESTEASHVIRTSDVHDVGVELANGLLDRITMAQESQVEIMFLVECKRDPSPLELHAAGRAGAFDLVAIAAMYREKGQAPANRESFVLAAGVGDAIDFLVAIREEGYPQGLFV